MARKSEHWTGPQVAGLARMWNRGAPVDRIAAVMSRWRGVMVSENAIYNQIRRALRNGWDLVPGGAVRTREARERRALELMREGRSWWDITGRARMSKAEVLKLAALHGVTRPPEPVRVARRGRPPVKVHFSDDGAIIAPVEPAQGQGRAAMPPSFVFGGAISVDDGPGSRRTPEDGGRKRRGPKVTLVTSVATGETFVHEVVA